MNANIIGSRVSSSKFDWNPNTREFVQEMSIIQHGGIRLLDRLYADAADTGFVMVSDKTGKEVPFYLVGEQRDAENEIRFWEFKPATNSVYYNPQLEGVTVIILND